LWSSGEGEDDEAEDAGYRGDDEEGHGEENPVDAALFLGRGGRDTEEIDEDARYQTGDAHDLCSHDEVKSSTR